MAMIKGECGVGKAVEVRKPVSGGALIRLAISGRDRVMLRLLL